ncbi:MAG: hypothetical protein WC831_04955 [Parcubacteria group bacterium]|jgi:hypothetical protein
MEKIKPRKKESANINDWAKALREKFPHLADMLDEDKTVGFQGVERLDLPRYRKIETTLPDFMDHAEDYFDEIGSREFYISLIGSKKEMERFGKSGLSRERVLEYIRENIKPEDLNSYKMVLQEYFENKFGGSIVIGEEKKNFIAELRRKTMSGIASGYVTPEITITRDASGVFRFPDNLSDPQERKQIFRAIQSIPHDGGGGDMRLTPGYYEFAIVKDDDGMIRPIFMDYRDNPAYQLAWEKLGPNKPKPFVPDE